MKNVIVILAILVAVLGLGYIIVRNNFKDAIDGKFNSFTVKNIRLGLKPIADIVINFSITNTSNFAFTLREFKVKIFNNLNGEYLTENIVKGALLIPKGESKHNITLKDNAIIGSVKDFLEAKTEYKAVISFSVWGVDFEFEQLLKL